MSSDEMQWRAYTTLDGNTFFASDFFVEDATEDGWAIVHEAHLPGTGGAVRRMQVQWRHVMVIMDITEEEVVEAMTDEGEACEQT